MVVLCNRRLGPGAELLVSDEVASEMLRATASAARPFAEVRWEIDLASWLDERADAGSEVIDVADIAWTPGNFEAQRRFLIGAIIRASTATRHVAAFERWRRMIEAHPADSVQVGRLWPRQPTA
jgi:hypothetical protein